MNKLSKGIIVGGLGVALLLGTGGSLALWNVSATSNGGQVVLGDLNLVVPATGQTWERQTVAGTPGTWVPIADISTYKMVPGDVVRLTQPLDITLSGTNMKAELAIDTSSAISAPAGGTVPGSMLTVTSGWLAAPAGESNPTQVGTTNVWRFNGPLATTGGKATFKQQVTFSLSSTATGRTGALATIDLSKTNFTLNQTYTNPPAA